MERRTSKGEEESVYYSLLLKLSIGALILGMMMACTQSLFIVRGTRNKVNQSSEKKTEVKVDSVTTNVDVK